MDHNVNFTLSFYQYQFHKTDTTLRNCVTSMPQREFHRWLSLGYDFSLVADGERIRYHYCFSA